MIYVNSWESKDVLRTEVTEAGVMVTMSGPRLSQENFLVTEEHLNTLHYMFREKEHAFYTFWLDELNIWHMTSLDFIDMWDEFMELKYKNLAATIAPERIGEQIETALNEVLSHIGRMSADFAIMHLEAIKDAVAVLEQTIGAALEEAIK